MKVFSGWFFLFTLIASSGAWALECQEWWMDGQCDLVKLIEESTPYPNLATQLESINCGAFRGGIACNATIYYNDAGNQGVPGSVELICEEYIFYQPGSQRFISEPIHCDQRVM